MITLITGAPGSGKTNALVELLAELAEGRALFVSGIPDLRVPHVELDDPHHWHTVVPDGAAIVIDEVQRVWRPHRSAIPEDIAALETHRHRGIDFFIVTQGPKLVHSNVRALVGRHVHLRDTGFTGRWWYEWPECNESCAYKTAPISKGYKLNKKSQALYTSASLHVKPIRSFPRALIVAALCIPMFGYLAWKLYSSLQSKLNPVTAQQSSLLKAKAGQHPVPAASGASQSGTRSDVVTYKSGQVVDAPALPASSSMPTGPASAPVESVTLAPSKPKGCIASKTICKCFDDGGMLVQLEPEACRDAIGVAGKVLPLDVPIARQAQDMGAPSQVAPVPMADVRRAKAPAVVSEHDSRPPGVRGTSSWQAPILQDIQRL